MAKQFQHDGENTKNHRMKEETAELINVEIRELPIWRRCMYPFTYYFSWKMTKQTCFKKRSGNMTKNRIIIKMKTVDVLMKLFLWCWEIGEKTAFGPNITSDSSRATQFTEGNHHDFDFQSCSIFISIMLLQKHRHLR